jgi:uncharacterized protein YihD (DUF1040 family)
MAKSGLITRVPLNSLCSEDFKKVTNIDKRYTELLQKTDEKSFHEIRREIKPYIFKMKDGNQITIMTNTRKGAEKAFKTAGHKMKEVQTLAVEYENMTRILSLRLEQKI